MFGAKINMYKAHYSTNTLYTIFKVKDYDIIINQEA